MFEYKVEELLPTATMEIYMNNYAKKGWRVISVVLSGSSITTAGAKIIVTFEREIKN